MPRIEEKKDRLIVFANTFSVIFDTKNHNYFTAEFETFKQDFFIPSCCDSFEKFDLNFDSFEYDYLMKAQYVRLIFKYQSNLWEKKYFLDIYDSHMEYYYDVVGKHRISNLHFFEGIRQFGFKEHFFTKHFNDKKTTPYREYSLSSPVNFKKVFNPEPNVYSKQLFDYFEYSQISVNSDFRDYCGGNFLFNPGILCYLISNKPNQEWISLGLAVQPNMYFFSDYEYYGGVTFGLNLNYCGLYSVNNRFQTPKIIICQGKTEKATLIKYIEYLTNNNLLPKERRCVQQDWWLGPIISPVGHQYYQTDLFRNRSPKERPNDLAGYFMCNQNNCEYFISIIDNYKLDWRIFVIDVKWFINAGLKKVDIGRWPDMKGFVSELHKRGKKVIIWWAPWDTEGWEFDECITYSDIERGNHLNRPGRFSKFGKISNNTKIAPDITLQSVKDKVTRQLVHLLSSKQDGINLDGLKIDHTADTPGIYGLKFPKRSKRLYGIELLRYYYKFLYDTVKLIKHDALIVGQSPNPYFIDCIDMIRLGDTYCHTHDSILNQMSFRYKMAKIADKDWLIDMDGWPMPSVTALKEYADSQVKYGVPSLYYATHIDTTGEKIPQEVWAHIKKLWDQYNYQKK